MLKPVPSLIAALAAALVTVSTAAAVTGGTIDGVAHPYVGALVVDGSVQCSGVLVAPTVFVTAGHCAADGSRVSVSFDSKLGAGWTLASGTLEVDGDEGTLLVANLPAPPRDEVYQAWLQHKGSDGGIVPSSVFVVHDDGSGAVAIPEGLDGAARVLVTREPEGGSKKPTEGALLTAELE